MFNLNPPTERGIDKVLKHIAECEDLCLSEQQLVEIRNQSNKDLRNAIVTLQFLAAGKSIEEMDSQNFMGSSTGAGGRKKRPKRMNIIEEEDEEWTNASQRTKTD